MGDNALHSEIAQQLGISPLALQSLEVLQVNTQELLDYLSRSAEENPTLDLEELDDLRGSYDALRQRADWIDAGASSAAPGWEQTGARDRETESLSAFEHDQLERLRIDKRLLALAKYLAELLDEDGYLSAEDRDSARELGVSEVLLSEAIRTLQGLEPAGIGAKDLPECLTLQLNRRTDVPRAAFVIADRYLAELSKKQYGAIARDTGFTRAEIAEAETLIASLDPRPGRAFAEGGEPNYLRPDVFVVEEPDGIKVVLNTFYLPRVSVNGYYERMLREAEDEETRGYLREKLRQAATLINGLSRREDTLQRCAAVIVELQRPFFTGETDALAPMYLSALSERLSLSLSTVSRAVRGKYLQCRRGTFPLRWFFSRPVGTQGLSRQAMKLRLMELIKAEDSAHPLSDQSLCMLLSDQGALVARRTVAKLRTKLRIGSSVERRRR